MKKNNSIKISKKHGVNPTIPICFWCGKEKNEIALLGRLPNDVEAPRSTWLLGDYEPCDSCKELRKQGIDLIEASDHPVIHSNQPVYHELYPTGRHIILKENAVRSIFSPKTAETLREVGMGFLDSETFMTLQTLIEKETQK